MERSNEERLDYFADMLEPAAEIFTDKEVLAAYRKGKTISAVRLAIKNHKPATIAILAALQCQSVEEYTVPGPLALMSQLIDLANSDEVQNLFSSQPQKKDAASSGAATGNIEDGAI